MFRIQPYLSAMIGLAVVGVSALEMTARPSAGDAEPFHAAAAEAIKAIPTEFGDWVATEIPVPQSAQALLKPNALLSRGLSNRATGEQMSLVLVQCRDTRDMAGHYPPICYPGQGWIEQEERREVELSIGSRSVKAMRYGFIRSGFDRERTLVVYNFFAVPGQGTPKDMDTIRRAASDYAARPFGAAQIQVVLPRPLDPPEERRLVESALDPLSAVVDLLSDAKWRQ